MWLNKNKDIGRATGFFAKKQWQRTRQVNPIGIKWDPNNGLKNDIGT